MSYWVILVLTYTFGAETYVSDLAFKDQQTCARMMDTIFPAIQAEYEDSMAQCMETDIVSGWTIRPKARPTQ